MVSSNFTIRGGSAFAKRLMSSSSSAFTFEKTAVVGLGLMGHGICQVTAMSKSCSQVVAYENEQKFLDSGKLRIEKSLNAMIRKERITQKEADDTLSRILFTTDVDAIADTDFIVEAVIENIDLKKNLYSHLGDVCQSDTIFASNTSSLSITEMAEVSGREDKFVGVHFFNPVQLMKLVEVIKTKHTDPVVFEKVVSWVRDIGKVAVTCSDTPGFIVNRLLVPSLMQAMAMVDRGDATVMDIDVSMKLGAGHPMGPIHLADYIGLDTCLFIVEGWVEKFPEENAFIIPQCLRDKVAAGDLGRKSGRGFYVWNGEKRGEVA